MRPGLAAIALLLFLGTTGRTTCGQPTEALESEIDSLVTSEALSRGVPAIAVAIVADGEILLTRGYGTADIVSGHQATATTPFNIASVTKPFTAAVVQMLADEGRFRLDDPVHDYLPMPSVYRSITIRQLLTHTSGIARDLRRNNDDDPDADEYRRRLAESRPSAAPGERFEYSNTGYTVLGWLIQAVEDRPLADVFRHRIFDPLGMQQARYRGNLSEDRGRARPHVVVDGVARSATFVSGGHGSGGISLSAQDLAAFALALQRGELLPQAELDAAWTPARLADGRPVTVQLNEGTDSYGFGWFITRVAGHRLLTHGGGITGFSANLYHFPDERITIGVLANAKGRDDGAAPVDSIARMIAEACLERDRP
jgi:CubicO group peptidase (beta-lactamase class C family)